MKKLLLSVVLTVAVLTGTGAQERETIRLAIGYIPHVQFAPLYVGIEKGFYREAGITLNIEYGFGIDIFSLLSTGRIDLGLSDSDQLILAGEKGLGLKAVFQYYQSYPVTIVTREETAATPQALAGKTIGTPEIYGSSYIGLRLFQEQFGLEKSVKTERIGYTQLPSLLSGKIDAAVCFYNNEPILLRAQGVKFRSWNVKDFSDMVGASFISSDRIIARRASVLQNFARATVRAIEYTLANPDEALDISLSVIGNSDPSQKAVYRGILIATGELFRSDAGFGSLDAAKYRSSIAALKRIGLIRKEFPAETILHVFR